MKEKRNAPNAWDYRYIQQGALQRYHNTARAGAPLFTGRRRPSPVYAKPMDDVAYIAAAYGLAALIVGGMIAATALRARQVRRQLAKLQHEQA